MSSLPAEAATAVALFAATNVDDLVVLALLSAAARAGGRPRRWQIWAGQYLGFAALVGLSLAAGRGLSLIPSRWLWLLALIPLAVGLVMLAAALRAPRSPDAPTASPPGEAAPAGVADPAGREPSVSAGGVPGTESAAGAAGVPSTESAAGAAGVPSTENAAGVPGLARIGAFAGGPGLSAVAGVVAVATLTIVDGADDLAAYTPIFATADAGRIAVVLTVFAVGVAVWCTVGGLLTRHHRITDALSRYSRWILPAAFILIGLYTLHTTNAPIHP